MNYDNRNIFQENMLNSQGKRNLKIKFKRLQKVWIWTYE